MSEEKERREKGRESGSANHIELKKLTLDTARPKVVAERKSKGFRTARENLEDLCDSGSFVEYGQLAVAARRQRRTVDELRESTPADGIITGLATINSDMPGSLNTRAAVVVYDFTVLAGTQGYIHHKKLDRIIQSRGLPANLVPWGWKALFISGIGRNWSQR